jgi:translation initiation factor eIF-2B subunit alpha
MARVLWVVQRTIMIWDVILRNVLFVPRTGSLSMQESMVERGELFLKKISLSRSKVAQLCHTFYQGWSCKYFYRILFFEWSLKPAPLEHMVILLLTNTVLYCHSQKILTHSSRVVLRVLASAAADKKRFIVYVTESQPDSAGCVLNPNACICIIPN